MCAVPLGTRALGNIRNIVFPFADEIHIVIDGTGDQLGSGSLIELGKIVGIFKAVLHFRKVTQQIGDQFLLLLGGRLMLPSVIDPLHTLALCNILNKMLGVLLAARTEIPAFQNDPSHQSSPFWNRTASSKRTAPRSRFTSSTHNPRSRERVSSSI